MFIGIWVFAKLQSLYLSSGSSHNELIATVIVRGHVTFVIIVNFEHISQLVLVFLLLTLNMSDATSILSLPLPGFFILSSVRKENEIFEMRLLTGKEGVYIICIFLKQT